MVFNYICTPIDIECIRNRVQSTNNQSTKIKLCVLVTDEETIISRDKMRPLDCQMGERSIILLKEFSEMAYSEKYYFDTSLLSVEETAEGIIKSDDFLL